MVTLVCVCNLDSHQFRPFEAGWDAVEDVRLPDKEWQTWWSACGAIEHMEDHTYVRQHVRMHSMMFAISNTGEFWSEVG